MFIMKVRTTLTIEKEVIQEAKRLGLNLSQFCETALIEAIRRLKDPGFPPISSNNPKQYLISTIQNNNNVRKSGPDRVRTGDPCHVKAVSYH